MSSVFLSLESVLRIHRHQVDQYGGSHGIRDQGALESALAQPQATFGGQLLHHDLYDQAAAYLFHIVENHPFIDGNKRVGAVVAIAFLRLNGLWVVAEEAKFEQLVMRVAQGECAKPEISTFFRDNSEPLT